MTGITFDRKISVQTIIAIMAFLGTVGAVWSNVDVRLTRLEAGSLSEGTAQADRDARQDRQLADLAATIKEILTGVQADRLENGKALAEIKVDVGYIRRFAEEAKREQKGQ